jgi:hypothetical protein
MENLQWFIFGFIICWFSKSFIDIFLVILRNSLKDADKKLPDIQQPNNRQRNANKFS